MSVNLLARIPLFADLPPEELDRLMAALDVVNLKPGDMLFHEGDLPEHLFIMVSGELEITMGSGTDNEMVLNTLKEVSTLVRWVSLCRVAVGRLAPGHMAM